MKSKFIFSGLLLLVCFMGNNFKINAQTDDIFTDVVNGDVTDVLDPSNPNVSAEDFLTVAEVEAWQEIL